MSVFSPCGKPMPANQLLTRIAPFGVESARLIEFVPGDVLWTADAPLDAALFPENGLVALYAADREGGWAEVGCIGRDGAFGLNEILADQAAAFECRALTSGSALKAPRSVVRTLFDSPDGRTILMEYLASVDVELRRAAACAARHLVRARLAECLLNHASRYESRHLPITQEMLSWSLGVARTTVTAFAAELAADGLIRTGRGWVAIADPDRLSATGCGCRRWTGLDARPRLSIVR